jgi:D-alanyl-D-alanine carboxypeptidase
MSEASVPDPTAPAAVGAGRRPRRRVLASAAVLAVAAMLAGCSDDGAGQRVVPTTAASEAGADAGVARGGVVASEDPRAEQIVSLIERAMPELDLQTVAFGVWQGDEEIVRGAIDAPGSGRAATSPDAMVRVGQPMEAMLGTILLQLHDEGVLDMDAPVERYVPELVNGDRITARMLANSTSGTPDVMPNDAFVDAVHADPFHRWTTDELLGYAQRTPPLFAPGEGWAYSHTDIALLGSVLEEATGQSLAELLATRIFEPVGMDSAESFTTNQISSPTMRAFTSERDVYEESTGWNPTWALHSGNMNATVADLGRWARALNRGDLLDDDSFELMMAPNTAGLGPMTRDRYFSFGMIVTGNWIVANPNLQGYQGFTGQLRDPEVTLVVYSTGTIENPGEENASVILGARISQVMAPDDPFVSIR